jgi:hypothetical protein
LLDGACPARENADSVEVLFYPSTLAGGIDCMVRTSRYRKVRRWFGGVWRWLLKRKEKIVVLAALLGIVVCLGTITGAFRKGIVAVVAVVRSYVSTANVSDTADANSTDTKSKLHIIRRVEVPANLLPLSFEQVRAFLNDEDKTIAEVRQFWKENGNRPVIWGGVVLRIEQADPNGPTYVGVGPASPRIAVDMILVKFSPKCAQDFLLVKNGDWINFLGTLDAPIPIAGFSFSRDVSVSDATLVAYARKPDSRR